MSALVRVGPYGPRNSARQFVTPGDEGLVCIPTSDSGALPQYLLAWRPELSNWKGRLTHAVRQAGTCDWRPDVGSPDIPVLTWAGIPLDYSFSDPVDHVQNVPETTWEWLQAAPPEVCDHHVWARGRVIATVPDYAWVLAAGMRRMQDPVRYRLYVVIWIVDDVSGQTFMRVDYAESDVPVPREPLTEWTSAGSGSVIAAGFFYYLLQSAAINASCTEARVVTADGSNPPARHADFPGLRKHDGTPFYVPYVRRHWGIDFSTAVAESWSSVSTITATFDGTGARVYWYPYWSGWQGDAEVNGRAARRHWLPGDGYRHEQWGIWVGTGMVFHETDPRIPTADARIEPDDDPDLEISHVDNAFYYLRTDIRDLFTARFAFGNTGDGYSDRTGQYVRGGIVLASSDTRAVANPGNHDDHLGFLTALEPASLAALEFSAAPDRGAKWLASGILDAPSTARTVYLGDGDPVALTGLTGGDPRFIDVRVL